MTFFSIASVDATSNIFHLVAEMLRGAAYVGSRQCVVRAEVKRPGAAGRQQNQHHHQQQEEEAGPRVSLGLAGPGAPASAGGDGGGAAEGAREEPPPLFLKLSTVHEHDAPGAPIKFLACSLLQTPLGH